MKTIRNLALPVLLLALVPRPAGAWDCHPLWRYFCDCPPPPAVKFYHPPADDYCRYPHAVPEWRWYGWGAARGGEAGSITTEALPQPRPLPSPEQEALPELPKTP
jgi:hypothetical protein